MTMPLTSYGQLSDPDLLREATRLAASEREATASLVASLAVLDQRRLYLAEGYGSLFVYCTQVLRLSESATYKRIAAARAAQRFPVILERLAAGDVTLTAIRLLAPHLTEANHVALLDEVRHRSTREVEQVVARLQPRPDVPSTVRKLPTPPAVSQTAPRSLQPAMPKQPPVAPAPAPTRDDVPPSSEPRVSNAAAPCHALACDLSPDRPRTIVTPLAPARYKVSFTIGAETHAKLREAQHLLRYLIPSGDVAALFDRALTLLLRDAAKTKHAATAQPRVPRDSSPRPVAPSRGSDAPGAESRGDGHADVPNNVEARQEHDPKPNRGTTAAAPTHERGTSQRRRALPGGRPAGGAAPTTPKVRSRHIPAEVKRRVWARDRGQCAFVSASGQRCPERGFLEYHHLVPYASGGDASVDNISLRCRHHNAHEAEQAFGPWPPSALREARPGYGGNGVIAREKLARVQGRQVFAGRDTAYSHAGHAATGRAASSLRPRHDPYGPGAASHRSLVRAP
jgi:hypothetical protein